MVGRWACRLCSGLSLVLAANARTGESAGVVEGVFAEQMLAAGIIEGDQAGYQVF